MKETDQAMARKLVEGKNIHLRVARSTLTKGPFATNKKFKIITVPGPGFMDEFDLQPAMLRAYGLCEFEIETHDSLVDASLALRLCEQDCRVIIIQKIDGGPKLLPCFTPVKPLAINAEEHPYVRHVARVDSQFDVAEVTPQLKAIGFDAILKENHRMEDLARVFRTLFKDQPVDFHGCLPDNQITMP